MSRRLSDLFSDHLIKMAAKFIISAIDTITCICIQIQYSTPTTLPCRAVDFCRPMFTF